MKTALMNFRRLLHPSGRTELLFVGFILFLLAHHAAVFLGFYDMDDLNYARYAANVLDKKHTVSYPDTHLSFRWVPVYVTALFYGLFGINVFSSSAFSLLCIILCGYLLLRVLSRPSFLLGVFVLTLFFLNYSVIFYAHRLNPDPGIAVLSFAAFALYQRRKNVNGFLTGSCFSILFFLMIITKETVILFLPLVIYFFTRDAAAGKNRKFWTGAAVSICLLLACYFFYFRINYGNWLHRFTLLEAGSYANACSYQLLPFTETLKRIGYGLWHSFLLNGDLMVLITGFAGYVYRRQVMPDHRMKDFAIAFFVLLLSANFMSVSITGYVPLCADTRHFLFLVPFAAVPGAYLLRAYLKQPDRYLLLPGLMAAATITMFVTGAGEMKYVYLLVTSLMFCPLMATRYGNTPFPAGIFAMLLAVCFLIRPLYDLADRRYHFFYDHAGVIRRLSATTDSDRYVLTPDDLTAELSEYLQDFRITRIKFRNVLSQGHLPNPETGQVYFLINRATDPELAMRLEKIPATCNEFAVVYKKGSVTLYRIGSVKVLEYLRAQSRTPVSVLSLPR